MHVAMIGQRGVPATYGGVERAVEELGAELVARGHTVTVYCRRGYVDAVEASHRGMQLVHHRAPRGAAIEAFVHSGTATAHALGHPPDVVHFHAIGPGLFSPLPRFVRRAAVVQTIQGMDNERARWGLAARAALGVGVLFSHVVPDETIVVSRELEATYRERWQRPTTYIPNGVRSHPPDRGTDELERLGLEPRRYLIWLGRFVPEKAPDLLLRAFRDVDTDVKLVLVGGSSQTDAYAEKLQRAAASDPRVVLPGFVYGRAKEQLLGHARALVQPSLLEGLPIVLLEAIAARLPIMASAIGPHVQVLGAAGEAVRLVEPGDASSLQAAMGWAASEPLQPRLDAAASLADAVLGRYDWASISAQTEEVYERALARARRSRWRGR